MGKRVTVTEKPDLNQPFSMALLGQYVRHRRTRENMRLEDAAALCGVSKQAYSDVEKAKGNLHTETVMKVCTGLGITLFILDEPEPDNDW